MSQNDILMTQAAKTPQIWDTRDVEHYEAFDYYRDGICRCFMPLRPELALPSRRDFRAVLRSWALQEGVLNLVSARAHDVLRTPDEINQNPEPGFYINLQRAGICIIHQHDRVLKVHPGEVALFEAHTPFTIDHSLRATLQVASLFVPSRHLPAQIGPITPLSLTAHPVYGRLISETAQTLAQAAEVGQGLTGLSSLYLSLITLCLQDQAADHPVSHMAQRARIYAAIRNHATKPDWTLKDCAAEVGLSERHIQRLLAVEGDGFTAAMTRERLSRATHLMHDPYFAHLAIADLALMVGYSDASPFSRAFREMYGMPPRQWQKEAK